MKKEILSVLENKYGDMKIQEGDKYKYLGMQIERDRQSKIMYISQPDLVNEILNEFNINNTSKYPYNNKLFNECDELLDINLKKKYHSAVMKLMYISRFTRPDIMFPTIILSTRVNNPTTLDYEHLINILSYLNNNKDYKVYYVKSKLNRIDVSCDSSYGKHIDGFSHTGYTIQVGCNVILSKSSKQKIIAKSSTEAELLAVRQCLIDISFVQDIMKEFNIDTNITLYQDNKGTIALLCNDKIDYKGKTTCEKVRIYHTRDFVKSLNVNIKYLSTNHMLADSLTKCTTSNTFDTFKSVLLMNDE